LAEALGYVPSETIFLFADMTARDLLQRRTTGPRGETVWIATPLIAALSLGRLVVLDGLHRLPNGTCSILLRLLEDGDVTLFDGTRFVRMDHYLLMQRRFKKTAKDLERMRIYPVHPNFRVIALATPPERGTGEWLGTEMMHLFDFHDLDVYGATSYADPIQTASLLSKLLPELDGPLLHNISDAAAALEGLRRTQAAEGGASTGTVRTLSLRQLIRLGKHAARHKADNSAVGESLASAVMLRFLPEEEKAALHRIFSSRGLELPDTSVAKGKVNGVVIKQEGGVLIIGQTEAAMSLSPNPGLVPQPLFVDIPGHTVLLEQMLQSYVIGDNILLIGNQGVGKNKLCDRLLQLLNREREYIQLHRDTTVQSLTLAPSLEEGHVVWHDSPLVRAMLHGRILVVDEFDKAPAEVVCVLKGLLEDGEMLLPDGRRFVNSKSPLYHTAREEDGNKVLQDGGGGYDGLQGCSVHRVADGFQLIALANRPGFPFLGNDFFSEMGDAFACHVVDNPDVDSELALLAAYGPGVPQESLARICGAFSNLRGMSDRGELAYPFSTREAVAVTKHLAAYPEDGVAKALQNVLAFDHFDGALLLILQGVMDSNGIDVKLARVKEFTPNQTTPKPAIDTDLD